MYREHKEQKEEGVRGSSRKWGQRITGQKKDQGTSSCRALQDVVKTLAFVGGGSLKDFKQNDMI